MAKREILDTANVQKSDIVAKINELDGLVEAFLMQFHKATNGQQSLGDNKIPFAEICAKKAVAFPEVLPGTYNTEDFSNKLTALTDFNGFKNSLSELMVKWETAARICKLDAMYYANEFYGIIQKEATRNTKYKPTLEELTPYYKRKADKNAEEKGKNGTVPTPADN